MERALALQARGHRFNSYSAYHFILRGCGAVGLTRWPVKPEIAGSSPVSPAIFLSFSGFIRVFPLIDSKLDNEAKFDAEYAGR